jgi:hypothetical protein
MVVAKVRGEPVGRYLDFRLRKAGTTWTWPTPRDPSSPRHPAPETRVVGAGAGPILVRKTSGGMTTAGGDDYEAALRRLPETHSLALRLQDSGTSEDVMCEYLHIEPEGLAMLLELANRKLRAELGEG